MSQHTQCNAPVDRHRFEFAFSIGAQYDSLQRSEEALRYYHEALRGLSYLPSEKERIRNRIVVLDRVAQCYQDQGDQTTAEKYYIQAIGTYDAYRSRNGTSVDGTTNYEMLGVLFNYSQQLAQLNRKDEASVIFIRATALAKELKLDRVHKNRLNELSLELENNREGT